MALTDREKERTLEMYQAGRSYNEMAAELGRTYEEIRGYIRRSPYYRPKEDQRQNNPPPAKPDADILNLIKRPTDREVIMDTLGITGRVLDAMLADLTEDGYLIELNGSQVCLAKMSYNDQPAEIDVNWKGNRQIRFGVVSDNHINSKYTQITLLHDAYDRFEREGIKHVYNVGDIDEGEQMRKGHQYECYSQGADDHVDEIVRVYPKRTNITTHFITGNHDASFIKLSGIDIGKQIANQRPDMNYLGQDDVIVNLTPGCRLEVMHPGGGSAYAWSYRPQKIVESLEGGTKPNVLLIGHYHKAEYLFYRNVHIIQAGTTQAQTPWMRSKALHASLGYWIIELDVTDEGQVDACRSTFFPCYQPIEEDYKNWREA